ncbi:MULTISPECIES: hypothetical protein [unclassified Lysobacter]|uniref:hypothetical protein n=1 Tax=unclassified Lysobacter TaxID=2635362 RepID=UPI001BE608BB|nr:MULTISPECIES: hypothetical protein [unclassified Lysobacter]MBT2750195.1 hypothetical protein [Lysobacter sp. ISL-50]MBT2775234.1 hypothetical protein [Lysobacter sp. ISL-54]MBT2782607.1 hypothetical protein [Lysobacter sp. ISL-52]
MNLHWRLFVSSKTEPAARKLAAGHFRRAQVEVSALTVAPCEKGGYKIQARSEHATSSWSDSVVAAIALAQRTGLGWSLDGLIIDELALWSTKASTAGIDAIEVVVRRIEPVATDGADEPGERATA